MARHAWKLLLAGLVVVLGLIAISGPRDREPAVRQPAAVQPDPVRPGRAAPKTTQKVLDLAAAIASGGVVVDPAGERDAAGLEVYSQAYQRSMAKIGGLAVEQKLRLYRAEHDAVPATHAEFMAKIIAPGTADEVRLPALPQGREYAFDPATRQLVIVAFPTTMP